MALKCRNLRQIAHGCCRSIAFAYDCTPSRIYAGSNLLPREVLARYVVKQRYVHTGSAPGWERKHAKSPMREECNVITVRASSVLWFREARRRRPLERDPFEEWGEGFGARMWYVANAHIGGTGLVWWTGFVTNAYNSFVHQRI
ncbi:hypothetical protein PAAG_11046 [Paracoccidioides lutzii Pb01]|uniref:Uncharacterized protein n=1 Tax=Paracoccidioides lutzii (strain ATCC MYA-826 / Pb01) TaxID=502779 RepID=A0A0A2V6Z5_PARBA|nr:hypothetical protein PAAG_11046 [Paracoccidioides lutzii Pb01]KGQ02097.1 hypothetical protein PAAG_11046 [Paracoccidioides lutzii Pb01]